MEQFPLLSYLIPSYNHAPFLAEALNSIHKDNYPNKEILILDDGSTDNSHEVVQRWIKNNPDIPVHFSSRANKGTGATLNELIHQAQGVFLRPLASDDMLAPGGSAQLILGFAQDPSLAAVFADCTVVDHQGNLVAESALEYAGASVEIYSNDLQKALIEHWAACGPCILWKKDNLLSTFKGYREDLSVEDWHMFLSLLVKNKIAFVPRSVGLYRVHPTNSSRTRNTEKRISNLKEQLLVFKELEGHFDAKGHRHSLRAKSLLQAKIAFLEKRPIEVFWQMLRWVTLRWSQGALA